MGARLVRMPAAPRAEPPSRPQRALPNLDPQTPSMSGGGFRALRLGRVVLGARKRHGWQALKRCMRGRDRVGGRLWEAQQVCGCRVGWEGETGDGGACS